MLLVAFGDLLSLSHLTFLLLGVLIGMAIGIFPGLGGVTGLALLMPFIYGMDAVSAMAMIIGLVAVTTTADTFTSVLAGIPGTSSSQATILDGFPLAKSGQATRALSAAFLSSLVGGVLGACVLTISIALARPVSVWSIHGVHDRGPQHVEGRGGGIVWADRWERRSRTCNRGNQTGFWGRLSL